jgi:hypothetical protein
LHLPPQLAKPTAAKATDNNHFYFSKLSLLRCVLETQFTSGFESDTTHLQFDQKVFFSPFFPFLRLNSQSKLLTICLINVPIVF